MSYTYMFPMPANTSSIAIFRENHKTGNWQVLLIKRGQEPFKGKWCLPGGFWNPYESAIHAATRETEEETGLVFNEAQMDFIMQNGQEGRDPRGWIVDHVFACEAGETAEAKAGDDAADSAWVNVDDVLEDEDSLAFDHHMALSKAYAVYVWGEDE